MWKYFWKMCKMELEYAQKCVRLKNKDKLVDTIWYKETLWEKSMVNISVMAIEDYDEIKIYMCWIESIHNLKEVVEGNIRE